MFDIYFSTLFNIFVRLFSLQDRHSIAQRVSARRMMLLSSYHIHIYNVCESLHNYYLPTVKKELQYFVFYMYLECNNLFRNIINGIVDGEFEYRIINAKIKNIGEFQLLKQIA